jgi:N utilization substance protein A
MEVPEIYDGTVVIKAAVREPGERAKIAVVSNERDVDPVGACVGMKGSRVQSIIRELRGEKIDIIEWSEDPAIFAANALSPAKVSKVTVIDFDERALQVTVENEQQSLAIGKRGQNVRLAAKLVGWQIDIRSEEEMKREIASQMEQIITAPEVRISSIEGISAGDSATLAEHGIETVEQLAGATVDDLSDWLDLSVDEAQELLDMAQAITEARRAHAREQSAGVGEAAEEVEATGQVGEGAVVEQGAEEAEEEKAQAPEAEAVEAEALEAEVGEEENEASAADR